MIYDFKDLVIDENVMICPHCYIKHDIDKCFVCDIDNEYEHGFVGMTRLNTLLTEDHMWRSMVNFNRPIHIVMEQREIVEQAKEAIMKYRFKKAVKSILKPTEFKAEW